MCCSIAYSLKETSAYIALPIHAAAYASLHATAPVQDSRQSSAISELVVHAVNISG